MAETKPIDDGGPAFPCATDDILCDPKGGRVHIVMRGGMSLRDWFAGQALAGDCASWTREDNSSFKVVDITERCYRLADAMLAARKAVRR